MSFSEEALQNRIVDLKGSDMWKRKMAVRAVQHWGEKAAPACPALIKQFEEIEKYLNENPYVVEGELCKAIVALGPASVPLLMENLIDSKESVKAGCVRALGELREIAEEASIYLLQIVEDHNESELVRRRAIVACGQIQTKNCTTETLEALADCIKEGFGNERAARSLAAFGELAIPLLLELLVDKDTAVSATAAKSLALYETPDFDCANSLSLLLVSGPRQIVYWVEKALLVHVSGCDMLIERLAEEITEEQPRSRSILKALAAIGSRGSRDKILEIMRDCPKFLRQCLQLLSNSKKIYARELPALLALLESSGDDIKALVVPAIQHYGKRDKAIEKSLIPLLNSENEIVRIRTIYVLGHLGTEYTTRALLKLKKSAAGRTLSQIYDAFSHLGSYAKEARPVLIRGLGSPEEYIRRSSVVALGNLGITEERVVKALMGVAATDEQWTIAAKAREALVNLGPSVIPHLVSARYECFEFKGKHIERKQSFDFSDKIPEMLSQFGEEAVDTYLNILTNCQRDIDKELIVKQLGRFGSHSDRLFPILRSLEKESASNLLKEEIEKAKQQLALAKLELGRTLGQEASRVKKEGSVHSMNTEDSQEYFVKRSLTEDQRKWLVEVFKARKLPFSKRRLAIDKELHGQISNKFSPSQIDRDLLIDSARITLFGLLHLEEGRIWADRCNSVIETIKSRIQEDSSHHLGKIKAEEFTDLLNIEIDDARFCLWLVTTMGRMFTTAGAASPENHYYDFIQVDGSEVYREYLSYEDPFKQINKHLLREKELRERVSRQFSDHRTFDNHRRSISGVAMSTKIKRVMSSLMFTDVKGYSQLTEPQMRTFMKEALPHIAKVLDPYRDIFIELNTWGDAITCATADPCGLAELALNLKQFFLTFNWEDIHLPKLSCRIALHAGVIYTGHDPIRNCTGIIGSQVNLAARAEPITPVGEVIVTQAFKQQLPTEVDSRFAFDDQGEQALAKGFGSAHLHRIRWDHEPNTKLTFKENETEILKEKLENCKKENVELKASLKRSTSTANHRLPTPVETNATESEEEPEPELDAERELESFRTMAGNIQDLISDVPKVVEEVLYKSVRNETTSGGTYGSAKSKAIQAAVEEGFLKEAREEGMVRINREDPKISRILKLVSELEQFLEKASMSFHDLFVEEYDFQPSIQNKRLWVRFLNYRGVRL